MGGYGSGRRRKRKPVVEQYERADAWQVTESITVTLATGGTYQLGTCPQCARRCKHLYDCGIEWKCRKCLGLSYALNTTRHRPAARLVHEPRVLEKGLESATAYLEIGQASDWGEAMQIIEAATETAELCLRDDIQERITEDDIERASTLMANIEAQLDDGRENYVTRDGTVLRVSLRVDSFCKLVSVWIALSNLRAARAAIMTRIRANRNEKKLTSVEILRREVEAIILRQVQQDSLKTLPESAQGFSV